MLLLGLPGDYNEDGVVDAADYTVWRDNFGAPAGTLANDTDGGMIGQSQYETWKANIGISLPMSPSMFSDGAATVPEPAGILLLGATAIWPWRRRRVIRWSRVSGPGKC
jgi:hypothetical protein